MKKLMIAAAIVCAAAFAHAAAYTWSGDAEAFDWNTDPETAGAGTIQFTIAGVVMEAIAFDGGYASFEYSVNAGDTVSAVITLNNFADGAGTMDWSFDFTQAFIDGKPTPDDALDAMTQKLNVAIDADGNGLDFSLTAAENNYTAATPTPEPTSGLLLLLGVAGLALRRRRA